MPTHEFEYRDTRLKRLQIFGLEVARVIRTKQQLGKRQNDKRLVCDIEMSSGGIHENVAFYCGGIDVETKFPHGLFAPPRKNQMVGILFFRGRYDNPVVCFPIPHPDWSLNEAQIQDLYNEPMDSLDDLGLYHFSGSRIVLRADGTVEFSKEISNTLYGLSLKIEDTDKKKTVTDLDNGHTVVFKDKNVIVTDSNGNSVTMNNSGMVLNDKYGNTIKTVGSPVKQVQINTHLTVDQ